MAGAAFTAALALSRRNFAGRSCWRLSALIRGGWQSDRDSYCSVNARAARLGAVLAETLNEIGRIEYALMFASPAYGYERHFGFY
jgi:hypothetical protein